MTPRFSKFAERLCKIIESCAVGKELAWDLDESSFNELALKLFSLQFDTNAPYQRFCEARGVVPFKIGHWSQIPAIPTSAFKEFDLTSLPLGQRKVTFHSSGTTGSNPSRHHHSIESLAVYEASLLPWFRRHVLPDNPPGLVMLSLTPSRLAAPNSSLVHMLDAVQRSFAPIGRRFLGNIGTDGGWALNFEVVSEVLRGATKAATPMLLAGTAFNFVHLVEHFASSGVRFQLPAGSRIVETGGYKGRSRSFPKADLHRLICDQFGVQRNHVVTEYGMSELSSQAYDGMIGGPAEGELFQFPPWARVQIISPETAQPVSNGQTGLIRLFDLANVASVMAVQTEDLAIARASGFELIGRAGAVEPRGCSLMASDS
jgi:hypothetical protein